VVSNHFFRYAREATEFYSDDPGIAGISLYSYQSILEARANCNLDVELYTAQYKGDDESTPEGFIKTPDLIYSFNDVSEKKGTRKLPLISEIIERLFEASQADFLIYSNMDIILGKDFYPHVNEIIERGYDSIIINRRRLPYSFINSSLDEICSQEGRKHPGFDCFIFHRSIYPKMILGNIVLSTFIGVTLAHNLFCFSKKFLLLDNERLTFHLGMKVVNRNEPLYYWFNRSEFFGNIKKQLWKDFDISKFPYYNLPIWKRYMKWGLNPSLFVYMNFKLEMRRLFSP